MSSALGFLIILKVLALIASSAIATIETGAWLDFSGEMVVHLHREGQVNSGVSLWVRPDAWVRMLLRLVVWQELVFQTWQPWMQIVSWSLTVWSAYVIASSFPGGVGGVARGLWGIFRR